MTKKSVKRRKTMKRTVRLTSKEVKQAIKEFVEFHTDLDLALEGTDEIVFHYGTYEYKEVEASLFRQVEATPLEDKEDD
jgi:hypothetical protein